MTSSVLYCNVQLASTHLDKFDRKLEERYTSTRTGTMKEQSSKRDEGKTRGLKMMKKIWLRRKSAEKKACAMWRIKLLIDGWMAGWLDGSKWVLWVLRSGLAMITHLLLAFLTHEIPIRILDGQCATCKEEFRKDEWTFLGDGG